MFKVKDPAEATECKGILERFGMTGPHNATDAFVKVLAAAAATLGEE